MSCNSMFTGIYRTEGDIKNFKIRVRLKKISNASAHLRSRPDAVDPDESEQIQTFSWQQKVFSKQEFEVYGDEANCLTDEQKRYHHMIANCADPPGRLFTYVQNDHFYSSDLECPTTESRPTQTTLHRKMSGLNIGTQAAKTAAVNNTNNETNHYEIGKFLEESLKNPYVSDPYETMYIMADLGTSDADIWSKSESILCSIKYKKNKRILTTYPDFSNKDPYIIELDRDGRIFYEYFLEDVSKQPDNEIADKKRELSKRKEENKLESFVTDFIVPENKIRRIYLLVEILSGQHFENDNIYVQYNIDLPSNWSSESNLCGSTQTCKSKGNEKLTNFGHGFEVILETDETSTTSPYIYFQVVSKDSWERCRSEGFAYQCIPVFEPGLHLFSLRCARILSKTISGNLRRFFIGDYGGVNDMTWIGLPKEHEGNAVNKYGVTTVGSGSIEVRVNIVVHGAHSRTKEDERSRHLHSIVPLVKTVDDVITAFKNAHERMLRARKKLGAQTHPTT